MSIHHHPRPYAGSYAVLRNHGADQRRLRALIYGEDDGTIECPECLGETGWIDHQTAFIRRWVECELCNGTGRVEP